MLERDEHDLARGQLGLATLAETIVDRPDAPTADVAETLRAGSRTHRAR